MACVAVTANAGGDATAGARTFVERILLPADRGATRRSVKPYLRYAVPAALFLANNVMYLGALSYVTPALLQTCVLSKVRSLLASAVGQD